LARYSVGAHQDLPATRRLSAAQQHRVVELVREQLGAKLSLAVMAAAVDLSPQHFARLFKTTFGTTAHAFVEAQRIDAAVAELRRDRSLPIAAIAAACGFSSQSHMTELMRRRLGVTPSALRRGSSASSRSDGTPIHPFEE
jgi:AraC family transcriptional regulator